MSRLPLTRSQKIYVNSDTQVTVTLGELRTATHLQPVVIKEQVYDSVANANHAIHEALNMASLEHPAIVKIFDCYLTLEHERKIVSVIVLERMEMDLEKEIKRRKADEQPWSEAELIVYLRRLVSALSFAQSKGISHRDIKPQNLFLIGSELKIGDFGSSARNLLIASLRNTLQGSPFYLSPELKRAYLRFMQNGQLDLQYDPVKSDMYSLGITFVYMAALSAPETLTNVGNLAAETQKLLQSLPQYPNLVYLLWYMLVEGEENRPGFDYLEQFFQKNEAFYERVMNPAYQAERVDDPAVAEPAVAKQPEEQKEEAVQPCDEQPCESDVIVAVQACAPQSPSLPSLLSSASIRHHSSLRLSGKPPPAPLCDHCGKLLVGAEAGQTRCQACQIPEVVRAPPCMICEKPILEKPVVDSELRELAGFAGGCCSFDCIFALNQLIDGDKCVCCEMPAVQGSRVVLACEHKFHDKNCLFSFMRRTNLRFGEPDMTYSCPECCRPINFEEEIKPAFAEGELEALMQRERISKCKFCHRLDVYLLDHDQALCESCYFDYFMAMNVY